MSDENGLFAFVQSRLSYPERRSSPARPFHDFDFNAKAETREVSEHSRC